MKELLLQGIREKYQSILHLPTNHSLEVWSKIVIKANPVFFYLNDGEGLIQIGEASRRRLMKCIKQEINQLQ